MLQAVRQRYQVESGRLLRVVDLEDPDTGAADQQVDVVGDAPPGAREGDTAENPEDLVKSSPDYYPGTAPDTSGYPNLGGLFGGQGAQNTYGGSGAGYGAQQGYGGYQGVSNVANRSPAAEEYFRNTGLPQAGATAQNPTGAPGGGTAQQPGPGQPGAPVNTQGVSGGAPNADALRSQILFNTDDPTTALNSALRSMGVNPFNTGNPFVQFIQRAAPGLAAAYMMQNAVGGQNAQSIADNPMGFKDFLTSSIRGGHTMGGLAQAAGLLPQIVAKIRETGGTNATEVNPFLNAIANVLGTGFGEGTTGILSALLGPSMNRTLAGGYKSGLEKALSNAQYNFPYEDVAEGQANGPDIWRFLLGV